MLRFHAGGDPLAGGDTIWQGFILPSNISQNVGERGRIVTLEATDGATTLHDYRYDGGTLGWVSLSALVAEAASRMGSNRRAITYRICSPTIRRNRA